MYADISKFSNDSLDFCKSMLKKGGVAITPGLDFDSTRGKQTFVFHMLAQQMKLKRYESLSLWMDIQKVL